MTLLIVNSGMGSDTECNYDINFDRKLAEYINHSSKSARGDQALRRVSSFRSFAPDN